MECVLFIIGREAQEYDPIGPVRDAGSGSTAHLIGRKTTIFSVFTSILFILYFEKE